MSRRPKLELINYSKMTTKFRKETSREAGIQRSRATRRSLPTILKPTEAADTVA